MKQKTFTTPALVLTGLMTAVTSVLSIFQIPMPSGVPITLQTFAIALCGYLLGWKRGTLAVFLYVLLGAIGVPVFTGMTAGFGRLFGMTGGFLFGFIPMALLCGLKTKGKNHILPLVLGITGLLICHLFGAAQYSIVADSAFTHSLAAVSLPYLVKDIISVIGAYFVSLILNTALRSANISL